MIHSEGLNISCVCPACLTRCNACMGTNTVVKREDLTKVCIKMNWEENEDDNPEYDSSNGILKPEDFID